ncbi:hypothetical protein F7725_025765 [Dissostichus mawsoni]|uniref:Uncharacterized protein n=1 Tax=Dissostichus mawsoni TaxID=36200 RepID=A0A7J5X556_DISMA|nr:hypothetical protein F7725_025765 [Dissostichus mawsoni]
MGCHTGASSVATFLSRKPLHPSGPAAFLVLVLKDGLPHWSQLSSNVSQQETAAPIWPSSFLGVGVLKCFSDLFDTDANLLIIKQLGSLSDEWNSDAGLALFPIGRDDSSLPAQPLQFIY